MLRGPGIEHLGDIGVIHHGQRLALRLEARDDLLCIHTQLDDLDCHSAIERLNLLGHPYSAKSALPDLLKQPVTTYALPFVFPSRHRKSWLASLMEGGCLRRRIIRLTFIL